MSVENAGDNPAEAGEQSSEVEYTEASLIDASEADLESLIAGLTQESEEELEAVAEDSEVPQEEAEASSDETADSKEQSDEESQEDFVKVSKADWEKQRAQLEQQEKFIQRRNTELGEVRKALQEARAQKSQDLDELYEDNPRAARQAEKEIEKLDADLEKLETYQKTVNSKHQAQKIFSQFVDPAEVDIEEMAQTARAIGLPDQVANSIRSDMFSTGATPMELVLLQKAAYGNKLVKALAAHAQGLQRKLNEAEAKPRKVLSNVSKALKASPQVDARSGGAGRTGIGDIDTSNMAELSEEELDRLLAKA